MKNNRKEKGVIILLILAAVIMTVGFANFAENLNINGNITVKSSKWSVHYDQSSYTESTGSVAASSKTITNTGYEFTATLNKPGEFYEATVKVVNDGTFGAKLTGLTMSTLSAEQQKYLTYTVTYDGTEYSASATGLNVALNADKDATVKVKVAYIQPENSADLPDTNETITITGNLNYQQQTTAN